MNRPTLLVIEAMVMMGPYLTNSGKFLDASALYGGTVRLAQSIGCKLKDPTILPSSQPNSRSAPKSASAESPSAFQRGQGS